ncbi:MAG: c-type cytochrome biogenesis protein CcmI [Nitrospira sp.]|nr:MAG: c-type cytochrome biogenesis protein CcmI [Nitrospira sp.]
MTVTFWAIVSAMTVSVLGLIVRPLLKRPTQLTNEQEKTLPVYRQQFAELEQDLTNGLLTDDQYQTARHELERRVLEETGSTETSSMMSGGLVNIRLVALSLVLAIPAASGVLYWTLGNPAAMTHPTASPMSAQGGADNERQMTEGLNAMVEKLKKKLEQNPNDATGLTMLARSYMAMERYADAVPTFEKAIKLNPNNADMLADYADALAVHQGRKLEGKPETLIDKALKVDPNHVKALMLAGTVAYNRKDFVLAVKDWERARANLPPDSEPEFTEQISAAIDDAKRRMGGAPMMAAANAPAASSAMPSDHPPVKKAGASRAITGKVVLGPSLAGKTLPDTLFVFAKDVAGPPMPVSIVRASKNDLPFTFRLDDSTSPMPSRKLSDIDTVVIVARLSKSGQAMPGSGDLEGMSQPIKPGTENITIIIDRERP